jgi:chromosomal replication initiator protein
VAYISIWGLLMTVVNTTTVLGTPNKKTEATLEVVLNVVADFFKLSIEYLKGNSRRREISWGRQIAMYFIRQYTGLSLPIIAEEFGGKHHTTLMYSCEKITGLQEADQTLTETLGQLSYRINMISGSQK